MHMLIIYCVKFQVSIFYSFGIFRLQKLQMDWQTDKVKTIWASHITMRALIKAFIVHLENQQMRKLEKK